MMSSLDSRLSRFDHLKPEGPYRAEVDGALNRRAVGVSCPECGAQPGFACEVDPEARPYPSTMKIGWGDPFHIARSKASDVA